MFRKVLVANRGEIAVRAFRAATELGAKTVAVFPHEDRNSEHRLKADEAYMIGEPGHPVRAYLDPAGIVATAVQADADAVRGAPYRVRSDERVNSRNGYRPRNGDTRAGTVGSRSRSCARHRTSRTGCWSGAKHAAWALTTVVDALRVSGADAPGQGG